MSASLVRLCIVIPMKDPSEAKSRLGGHLPPAARAALARTLFRNTLRLVRDVAPEASILVVSRSAQIAPIADALGARVIDDPGQGLNAAVSAGVDFARGQGHGSVCVLPGDLADPEAGDLAALLARAPAGPLGVVVPSHDGGTNALLLSPPAQIGFAYGPGSFRAHQDAVVRAGLPCIAMPLESLLHDVDTVADLGPRLARGLNRSLAGWAR